MIDNNLVLLDEKYLSVIGEHKQQFCHSGRTEVMFCIFCPCIMMGKLLRLICLMFYPCKQSCKGYIEITLTVRPSEQIYETYNFPLVCKLLKGVMLFFGCCKFNITSVPSSSHYAAHLSVCLSVCLAMPCKRTFYSTDEPILMNLQKTCTIRLEEGRACWRITLLRNTSREIINSAGRDRVSLCDLTHISSCNMFRCQAIHFEADSTLLCAILVTTHNITKLYQPKYILHYLQPKSIRGQHELLTRRIL